MIKILERINPINSIHYSVWPANPFELHNTLNQFDIQIDKSQLINDTNTVQYFFNLLTNESIDHHSHQPFITGLQSVFGALLKNDDEFAKLLPAVEKLPFESALSIWIVLYKAASHMYPTPRIENIRKLLFKILEKKLANPREQDIIKKGILLSIDKNAISNEKKLSFLRALKPFEEKYRTTLVITRLACSILIFSAVTLGIIYVTSNRKDLSSSALLSSKSVTQFTPPTLSSYPESSPQSSFIEPLTPPTISSSSEPLAQLTPLAQSSSAISLEEPVQQPLFPQESQSSLPSTLPSIFVTPLEEWNHQGITIIALKSISFALGALTYRCLSTFPHKRA